MKKNGCEGNATVTPAACKLTSSKVLCMCVPLPTYYKCTNLQVVKVLVRSAA